jgi:hypothetical protein
VAQGVGPEFKPQYCKKKKKQKQNKSSSQVLEDSSQIPDPSPISSIWGKKCLALYSTLPGAIIALKIIALKINNI